MSNERKSLMAAAGAVGDAPNVADVFAIVLAARVVTVGGFIAVTVKVVV